MKIKYSLYQTLIFCFYVISGEIKFLFSYYNSPIDITVLFGALVTIDIFYNTFFCPSQIKLTPLKIFFLFIFLSFYLLFFFSLLYTPSIYYAYKKTAYFLLTLLAFTYPIFLRNFNIDLFAKIVFAWTLPASVWFILMKHFYWSGYKAEIGEEFDVLLGSYAGLSVNVAFLIFYFTLKRQIRIIILLILLLLALGSRGTLLFVTIVIVAFEHKAIWSAIQRPRFKTTIKRIDLFILLLVFPVLYFFRHTIIEGFKFGLGRFQSILNYSADNSTNERIELYKFSIKNTFDSAQSFFFGHGIGSFGVLFNGYESRTIPHNIFLEAWFELGILSVLLLLVLGVAPLLIRNRNQVIKMMALFFLLDAMKSGGFDEMRFMFGIYGILIFWTVSKYPTKDQQAQSLNQLSFSEPR